MSVNRRGIALVSVLFALVAVLTLASTLFFSVFVELQAASNASAGEEALYAAEAGMEHLASLLDPAPDFAREASWTDGTPPFGSPVWFPAPPRTYRVRVTETAGGTLKAMAEGTSHRGARRRVEAVFRRAPRFRPRAALTLGAGGTISDASGTIDVEGPSSDRERVALGAETRADAAWLRALRSAGSLAVVGPSGLAAAARRLAAAATVTLVGPVAAGDWGDTATPALVRIAGPADLAGPSSIVGLAIAEGPLRVSGPLDVQGMLLAPDGLEIAGELSVEGGVFVAGDLRVLAGALVSVVDDEAAFDLADDAASGTLPRAAVRTAWRELW